jgi:hypothetical protein
MLPPHRRNSFSYKAIDRRIRDILDERSILENTVQVGMPFIKVTSTIDMGRVAGYDVGNTNNYGFTLGLHVTEEDLTFRDMYTDSNGEYLIGYTYQPPIDGETTGRSKLIYTIPPGKEINSSITLLDAQRFLVSDTESSYIPPPGITSATIGRNKNGLLSVADISFTVPTLPQLEALHRTFLIPGVGMIVEWGQQFAPKKSDFIWGETGLETEADIRERFFPWYDRDKLVPLLNRLAEQRVGLEEILQDYTYPSQGQYQWMFGRVANFEINSNSDGSFECSVKIVGPSEDSFPYSTRNTVISPKLIGTNQVNSCPDKSNSVESYFKKTTEGKNFKTLLEQIANGTPPSGLEGWTGHVVKVAKKRNFRDNLARFYDWITNLTTSNPQISEEDFADSEDAYFLSWRFFVNIVLNDEDYGVKSIFKDAALSNAELNKISLLRPYTIPGKTPRESGEGGEGKLIDPYENYVGGNTYLRSIDPSTLIIVNGAAVTAARQMLINISSSLTETQRNNLIQKVLGDANGSTEEARKMDRMGDFLVNSNAIYLQYEESTGRQLPDVDGRVNLELETITRRQADYDPNRAFLSTGVWLNHKAVSQAMVGSNTILGGINNLLKRMNAATSGFWGLAIDSSEPDEDDNSSFNFGIVDINYKESSEYAVKEFFEKVHVFNKYIRERAGDGTRFGSDVIESNINLNLPKLLFAQIATLGLHQPSDMKAVSGDNGSVEFDVDHPKFPDAQEQLRKMFAITSLAQSDEFDKGPDLTALSKKERNDKIAALAICGTDTNQTTAMTGGRGVNIGQRDINTFLNSSGGPDGEDIERQIEVGQEIMNFCNGACRDDTVSFASARPVSIDRSGNACSTDGNCPNNQLCIQGRCVEQPIKVPISQLPIGYFLDLQASGSYNTRSGNIGAIGKYQLVGTTFKQTVDALGLPGNQIFNEQIQELMARYLLFIKQPSVLRYLRRENNNVDAALAALQNEFVSLKLTEGGVDRPKRTRDFLTATRAQFGGYTLDDLKTRYENKNFDWSNEPSVVQEFLNFIGSVEGGRTGYDGLNVRNKETLKNTKNYLRAINNLPPAEGGGASNQLGSTADEQPTITGRPFITSPPTSPPSSLESECEDIGQFTFTRSLDPCNSPSQRPNIGLSVIKNNPTDLYYTYEIGNFRCGLPADGNYIREGGNSYLTCRSGTCSEISCSSSLFQIPGSQPPPTPTGTVSAARPPFGNNGGRNTYTDRRITLQEWSNLPEPKPEWIGGFAQIASTSNFGLGISTINSFDCSLCETVSQRLVQLQTQAERREEEDPEDISRLQRAIAAFPEYEKVFKYIEMLPDWMVTEITNDGNDIFSNAFGAAPGTLSISGDIVLPGINGLRVGELFWIDRIPTYYRAFGAFQVISLEDIIGKEGWSTKIHARFNYLGGTWVNRTSKLLSGNAEPFEPIDRRIDPQAPIDRPTNSEEQPSVPIPGPRFA